MHITPPGTYTFNQKSSSGRTAQILYLSKSTNTMVENTPFQVKSPVFKSLMPFPKVSKVKVLIFEKWAI